MNNINQNKLEELIENFDGSKGTRININNLPNFEIFNRPDFATLKLYLKKNESVIVNSGYMKAMIPSIKTITKTQGGFFRSFFRMFFTSVSLFMTEYVSQQDESELLCGDYLMSDILPVIIEPGTGHIFNKDSLICYTNNLELNTKFSLKNFFMDEGYGQIKFINKSQKRGMVWVAAYGGFNKVNLKEGESLNIDNGYFLESNENIDYSISSAGGLKTTLLGGEGLLMKFKGPCEFYIKGNNLNTFIDYLNSFKKNKDKNIEFNFENNDN